MRAPSVSLRSQLILWNVVTLAVLLTALGLTTRVAAISAIIHSVDQHLEDRAHAPGPPPPGPPPFGDPFPPGPPPSDAFFHQGQPPSDYAHSPGPPSGRFRDPYHPRVFDSQGHSMERPAERPWDMAALAAVPRGGKVFSTISVEGEHLRVLTRAFPTSRILQVAYPLADVDRAIAGLDRALLLLIPVALLVAGLGGAALTARVLRPVRQITQAAARMGDTTSARLPALGEDEFAAMADTFNGLLERLDTSFQQQRQLLEQQRRFIADASHELKTPLTAILGTASQMQHGRTSEEDYRQAMAGIGESAESMARLVQDLLLLARSDEGQMGKRRIVILVREVLMQALSRLPENVPPIFLEMADETLTLCGNEEELVRLFANLLLNAARATPSDGKITVSARNQGRNVAVNVTDTGVGIAPEHLAHLGERFYRIDSARARRDGGTGLGLSICRSIVAAHEGTMTFASAPGLGTTVTVILKAD